MARSGKIIFLYSIFSANRQFKVLYMNKKEIKQNIITKERGKNGKNN